MIKYLVNKGHKVRVDQVELTELSDPFVLSDSDAKALVDLGVISLVEEQKEVTIEPMVNNPVKSDVIEITKEVKNKTKKKGGK